MLARRLSGEHIVGLAQPMGLSLSRFVKDQSATGIAEPTAIKTQVFKDVSNCFAAHPQQLSIVSVKPVGRGRNFPNKFPLLFLMAVKENCPQDQLRSLPLHDQLVSAHPGPSNTSMIPRCRSDIIDDGGSQRLCHKADLGSESRNPKIRSCHLVVIQ